MRGTGTLGTVSTGNSGQKKGTFKLLPAQKYEGAHVPNAPPPLLMTPPLEIIKRYQSKMHFQLLLGLQGRKPEIYRETLNT